MEEIKIENIEKKEKKRQVIQIVFLIILIIAIAALVNATVTIYRYRTMLSNPIGYSLEKFHIPYCEYIDSTGKIIIIPSLNKSEAPKENKLEVFNFTP